MLKRSKSELELQVLYSEIEYASNTEYPIYLEIEKASNTEYRIYSVLYIVLFRGDYYSNSYYS